jgi:hypothetical protein
MRRVVAWLCSHPLTTGFLVLIGCAVGTHLFANWRAEVRWQHYCTEARARGVKLTLAEFAPPEIPDAENFAALPMFRAIFNGGVQRPMELPTTNGTRPEFGNALKGERMDWTAWQTFFKDAGYISETTDSPPRDVLRGVEHYAPQFKEWGEWRTRPRCRFTLDTRDVMAMPLTHLGAFVGAAKLFALRMRVRFALHDSGGAYGDFREGLQAYHALKEEPVLITGLVRISALNIVLAAVGDGLAQSAWTDTELKAVADDLALVRVGAAYLQAFSSERGFGNQFEEQMIAMSPLQRAQKYTAINAANFLGTGGFPPSWLLTILPQRLYRDNQLRYNLHMDELCARATDAQTPFLASAGTPTSLENPDGLDAYYYFLFTQSNAVFSVVASKFVRVQTQLDQTRIAIALERFRLARGAYPETLAELVPEFIEAVPAETYSRQPMIYRPQDGGTFLLYGVGENRQDDGGVIDPKLSERRQRDDIWLCAPPAR